MGKEFHVEAVFGGFLALVVLAVALFAVFNTSFSGASAGAGAGTVTVTSPNDGYASSPLELATGQDLVCECYSEAFDLAARAKVLSPEYRTGFEQCRARGGVNAGDAWTAGWNARLSARPFEASCRAYKRGR
ncbi:MAG: hypothetical protein AAGC77_14985 [Pseudomonadota bacterium]